MADAQISIKYKGREANFVLRDVDLDEKRDKLALEVGRSIVDAAWSLEEGK